MKGKKGFEGAHIIDPDGADQDEFLASQAMALQAHVGRMVSQVASHQRQVQIIYKEIESHYEDCAEVSDDTGRIIQEEKPVNGHYVAVLRQNAAIHYTAIDSIGNTFALLVALGVPGIPVPAAHQAKPEGVTTQ